MLTTVGSPPLECVEEYKVLLSIITAEKIYVTMKKNSKLSSDVKSLVLSKAQAYIKPEEKAEVITEDSDDEERKELRKATKADKERKREKMRLKKHRKREAREKSKKKDTSEAKKLAINYLHLWNSARDMWSFKKKQQCWLLNNIYDVNNVSDDNFKILLNYIIELKGLAKDRLAEESEKMVKKHEEKFEDCSISADDSITFERARNVLQILV